MPDSDDVIKIRVTVTGTYDVLRSDLPEDYELPADSPVEDILKIDREENICDEFRAVTIMEDDVEWSLQEAN